MRPFLLKVKAADLRNTLIAGMFMIGETVTSHNTTITATGVFLDNKGMQLIRDHVISGDPMDYELAFTDGETRKVLAYVKRLDYIGSIAGESRYQITLNIPHTEH